MISLAFISTIFPSDECYISTSLYHPVVYGNKESTAPYLLQSSELSTEMGSSKSQQVSYRRSNGARPFITK